MHDVGGCLNGWMAIAHVRRIYTIAICDLPYTWVFEQLFTYIYSGPKKTPFCVLKDELFTSEDELSWADGQK